MNLAIECIEKNVRRNPNRIAVIDGSNGATTTYAELDEKVNRMATALQSIGVQKGDRVGLYLRNIPEFIITFLANCKLGAVSVPFNIMLKRLEVEYILNNSGAKVVVGMAEETRANLLPILGDLPHLERVILVGGQSEGEKLLSFEDLMARGRKDFQALDLAETDAISLLYTSGTTGRPKGALASHGNWAFQTWSSAYQIVPMTDEDIVLTGGPFFHVYLVIAVLPTLFVGATVITLPRFFPKDALELITRHKASHFMGTPTMWTYLIDEFLSHKDQYDVSSLWQGQSAGAPLPAELGKKIEATFGIGLVECYGATECSSTVTHTRFGHLTPGHAGRVTPGWEVRIMDDEGRELPNGEVGELCCRGPGVVKEYWRDPEMTRARFRDGWWRSGDLGSLNGGPGDGEVHIVDRKDDMITCGGFKIFPTEVDNYLMKHPKILHAVVVGIPDPVKSQVPKAFVVLNPGEKATGDEIISWAKTVMAAYKVPRVVEVVSIDDLPKTASGKILKRELRAREFEKSRAKHP